MAKNHIFIEWIDGLEKDHGGDLSEFSKESLAEVAWEAGIKHGGGLPMRATVECVGKICKINFAGTPKEFAARLAEAFKD